MLKITTEKMVFEPTNLLVFGFTSITSDGTVKYELFDDIMQLTFSTPVDTKPVLLLGSNELLGYTYGARLYAGTMLLPANSYPSFFRLFSDWLNVINAVYRKYNSDSLLSYTLNLEDLPPFDMVIMSIPEVKDEVTPDMYVFLYIFKYVKFVETTVELSVRSPDLQIAFYRFTANYVGQKLVRPSIDAKGNISFDAELLTSTFRLQDIDPLLSVTLKDTALITNNLTQIIRQQLNKR